MKQIDSQGMERFQLGNTMSVIRSSNQFAAFKTMPEPSQIRAGYDRWAPIYDHDANPLPALEEPLVRNVAGDLRGLSVLDLGCGTGRHTAWLAQAGAHVTGIDSSAGMLDEARRKIVVESVKFVEHDLHQPLPLMDAAFDLVVCGLVLEHLADLPVVFAEMRRMLRPRGRAVVSAMHPAMFLRNSQARFTDPKSGDVVAPGSINHSLSEIVMAAIQAGFCLTDLAEYEPDAEFAGRYRRAKKYIGWPMLALLVLSAESQ
jgi:malonyl-CoA O-methyltransferase